MEFSGRRNQENDSLKDFITYFAGTVEYLPEVKLDKLIYIAQLYHYSNYGELLTKTRFFSLGYGPHAPLIRPTLKKQIENKSMYLKESRTSSDPVYSNPCLIIRSRAPKDGNLSFSCLETLREVLEDWGDAPYEHILDYTTRTIPYLSTFYREPIDWASIQPYSDLRYALSFPQRLQIHRFVKEPEKTVCQYSSHSESRVVSINEVAEIYLALCGNQPDKIPSRENLGFNLKTVLYALEKVRNKKEVGTEKYPAEIARAARLTDALLNSMSFRSYSSRVALEAGMLFLKKSGYSFDRDILEDHWPDGDSPEILKKWFRRMCEKVDTQ